jgi:DNA-binding beta-propeller fold protein YncE
VRPHLILFISFLWLGPLQMRAAQIVLVAGTPEAPLHEPFGAEPDSAGNLFIIEMASGNRLLKVDARGQLTHLAGTGSPGDAGDRVPALSAQFNGPHNLVLLPDGDLLIADTWNGRIRRFHAKMGTVTTVPGYAVPPQASRKSGPYCIALAALGTHIFIADLQRVHSLDLTTAEIKTVAGNGKKGQPEDGAVATEAPLVDPRAVAADRSGNVYVLERGGHALRVVDPAGRIRTVVNAEGRKGATGDGGPGTAATMNGPKHLCIDHDGGVLIADAENHLIRKYWPKDGTITRIAGTGQKGSSGLEGDPKKCELSRPHGVSVHPKTGEIFITDSYNNRILKIAQ